MNNKSGRETVTENTLHFTFQIEREIKTIEIEPGVLAYCDIKRMKEEVIGSKEGIVKEEILEKLRLHPETDLGKEGCEDIHLFRKKIVEVHKRENVFLRPQSMEPYYIDQPYSFIQEHGLKNVILLGMRNSTFHLHKMDGSPLVHPIYFNASNGAMVEEYFDIEGIYEQLKNRDDIEWERARSGSHIIDSGESQSISFKYFPSVEVWEKISAMTNSLEMREFVMKYPLNIQKFQKEIN